MSGHSLAEVWDGLTPDERRCLCMMIDAKNLGGKYERAVNNEYSDEFQIAVIEKCKKLAPDKES